MWPIEHLAKIDYETYSEAGYAWNEATQKWDGPPNSKDKGIRAVGAAAYAEHPSTEVLTFSYRLPFWPKGLVCRWRPGMALPQDLFDWIAAGGLVEAHNVMFERLIWHHVCERLYGWPPVPAEQWRCSAATARVQCYPGALGNLTAVLPVEVRKDADGKRLLDKFSVPRNPTKKDPRLRILPSEEPEEAERLYAYCDDDVRAEEGVSEYMMPMTVAEREFWQIDQEMNWRGIGVDMPSVRNQIAVMEQVFSRYGVRHQELTGGLNTTQVAAVSNWLGMQGVQMKDMRDETVTDTLKRTDLTPAAREVLEIRQLTGSAGVKKLYALDRAASRDDRIRNIVIHHGARTGRPTGDLVQPLNLVKDGPDLIWCEACNRPSSRWPPVYCPWCGVRLSPLTERLKWPNAPIHVEANPVDSIQEIMATRDLGTVEYFFGDALLAMSGSIRGMFQAAPQHELIASDYTAIEAVVTAAFAGCEWRLDVFRRREDIYLASASRATGTSLEVYEEYKKKTRNNHPDRNKIGKYAELACGFGGWLSGWRGFDKTDNLTDDEVKKLILAWRAASPEIVELWGGQARGRPWDRDYHFERFGFEGCFVNAIQYPGERFEYAGIKFYMRRDAMIMRLLSGRELTYNSPRLHPSDRGAGLLDITYMTWNSNPKYGPVGWVAMKTYAGKIAENCIQATAHDIQRYGIINLRAAGYPMVLTVYDEDVAEVPLGWGSIEEFERIMSTMPPWAANWPIRASGGWRGKRYRKG